MEWPDVQQQVEGLLKSSMICCRVVVPGVIERGFGRLVFVITNLVFNPEVAYRGYTAASRP